MYHKEPRTRVRPIAKPALTSQHNEHRRKTRFAASGLRLTDESVAAAVAAAQQLEFARVQQQVAAVLKATPPELAHQHSGLTPLMRFACTAVFRDPVPAEV
jgi:hypothetical protein